MSRQRHISGKPGATWLFILATVMLAITLCTTPSFAANFGAATNVGALSGPNEVAYGNFNAGTDKDLVFVSPSTNTVKFLQNDGSGVFSALGAGLDVSIAGGDGPFAVAVGDFDKDNKDDVAIANIYSGNVSVFIRQGDGTFFSAAVTTVGNYPSSIVSGDFDGDTYPDLAVTNYFDDTVSILLNNGDGTFAAAVNYATGAGPYAVRTGALISGGNLDLIVANNSEDSISILTGIGNGTFVGEVPYATGSGPVAIAVGDFDKDGKLDIATANFSANTVSVLIGNGTGTVDAKVDYEVGLEPMSIEAGDFNGTTAGGGDTFLDLAVANRGDDTVTILRNKGGADVLDAGTFEFADNYAMGNGPSSIVAIALNGDSLADLATANDFGDNASILLATDEDDAPTGTIVIDEGSWVAADVVNLTLTASEESGGAITMKVCNTSDCSAAGDDVAFGAFAATRVWTLLSGNGIKTVYVWFRDARGNISDPYTAVILLDNTAPGNPIIINNNDDYTSSSSVTLVLGGAGADEMEICNAAACGTWIPYAATKSWTLLAGQGTKTVYARFRNARATSGQFQDSIIVDSVAPTGSIVIENNRSATLTTSVDLTLEASEESGGAIQMCISNTTTCTDGSGWIAFAASKAWTLTAGEGTKTVYAWFKDARGNVSGQKTDTIEFKSSKPTGSIVINGGAVSTDVPAVILTLTKSGDVVDMCISNTVSCSSWIPAKTTMAWTLSGATTANYTVYAKFRTEEGIISDPYSDSIYIDKNPPQNGSVSINAGAAATTSDTVTLTLSATDAETVVAEMCINNTGNPCTDWVVYATTKSWTLSAGQGVKTVYAWFKDAPGNVTSSSVTDTIILDSIAPTGTVGIDAGAVNTAVTAVNLTLSAADANTVTDMCISNTGNCNNAWEAFNTSKAWMLTAGDGVKTVSVWFKDQYGNESAAGSPYTDTIILDATAPTGGSIIIDADATSTASATVTLTIAATDASEMKICNTSDCSDGGDTGWIAFASPKTWTILAGDGVKTVRAWFRDTYGNATVTAVSDTIILDTTPPTGSVSIDAGAVSTGSTSVTLTLAATDASTVVTEMCVSNTNSCTAWISFATTKSWTLSAGQGVKTVYVWFKDTQGNVIATPETDTIILDSMAPTGSVSIAAGAANTAVTAVNLTLSAADANTVTSMCISNTANCADGDGWIAYATSNPHTLTSGDGVKTVSVWFRDEFGNETAAGSPYTDTIILDATAPTGGSVVIDADAASTASATVTLTIAATDASEMKICNTSDCSDGGDTGWIAFASPKTWTILAGDGVKTVRAWFRDTYGNATVTAVSDTIILDTTPPTGSVSIDAGAVSTGSTSVTLTLAATDASTVVTEMCVSNTSDPCTNWVVYATTKSWTLTAGQGVKTVYVWFKDTQGNVIAAPETDTIILDATAPTGTVSIDAGAVSTILSTVTLTLSATDDSPVTNMCISNSAICVGGVNTTGWIAYATTRTLWPLIGIDGTKTVYVWFRDQWGNETAAGSPETDTIILDTTPPTAGSISIDEGAATASTSVNLTLAATDVASNVTQMCISNTTTCTAPAVWEAYNTAKEWTLTAGDGVKTVRAWFKDGLGNATVAAVSDTITLDTASPTGSVVINSGAVSTNVTAVTLTLVSADATGPVQMCISNTANCVDGSGWIAFAASKAWTLDAVDGIKTVNVWFKDALGNASATPYSDTITLDSDAPTGGSITINGGSFTKSVSVTLTLAATNATEMCISNVSNVCTTWVPYAATSTKAWTLTAGDGTKTVYVKYRDALGNTTVELSDIIVLDTTVPTNGSLTAANGNTKIDLSWSGMTDGGSDVASYKIMHSITAAPTNCTGLALATVIGKANTTYSHTGLTNGLTPTHYYRVCAVDTAGNMAGGATASAKAVNETDPPVGTMVIVGATTKTAAVTLNLTANDATPAGIQMCISNTGTCTTWAAFATTKTWTLTAGNGIKTVNARFRDQWGNTSAMVSDTIIFDSVAPTGGTITPDLTVPTAITLDWSGIVETGSGIDTYKLVYSTVSVTAASCTTPPVTNGGLLAAAIPALTPTFTHTGLVNGTTYYYRVCAIDLAGNRAAGITVSAKPVPELVPPVGDFAINGGALYTKTTASTLTMEATDNDSGMTGMQMCISNTNPATTPCTSFLAYAASKAWTLPAGNGIKTVYVVFRDKWGNASAPINHFITLDATAPTNGTLDIAAIDSQNDLNWSGFVDNAGGSGIASYKVVFSTTALPTSCSAGTTIYSGSNTTYSHISLTNGTTNYYRVCATDNAGNVSTGATGTGRWVPENNVPTGTVSINNGDGYTKTTSVSLALTAADDSAVTQMCISNTAASAAVCTPWVAYVSSKAWTLAAGTATTKTVKVWIKDEWGNTSALISDTIELDAVKPVDGSLTATAGNTQVQLSWSGFADAASGLASYKLVSSTTAAPTTCTGTAIYEGSNAVTTFTHLGLTNGTTYYYRLCAIDNVGNMSVGVTRSAVPAAP